MTGPSAAALLVGCGKMGGALLSGWLARGTSGADAPVIIIEPASAATAAFRGKPGITVVDDAQDVAAGVAPRVVVFAVKPQGMDQVVPAYRRFVSPYTAFLSIAAGRPIAFFERHLGPEAAVVRSMPNTPAAIGRGITVACANAHVSREQRDICGRLLSAVGEVAWVEDERLLDPVTAVSGSGPAYVFLLVEALAEAGQAAGLPAELAMRLARATVAGSGELLHQAKDPAEQLRRNVTSPGGTTAAALEILMAKRGGLSALLKRAVAAATRRSRELAG
ncbi:MAG TPA: pyrroline-5-carboxylate reductase [Alphaproteobacteria bacterium]|nr:pyrroline-5-carboxylate reductase [Alphaproteobacteria bacterium]